MPRQITEKELAELLRKANAATQNDWRYVPTTGDLVSLAITENGPVITPIATIYKFTNLQFIQAANPDTIFALNAAFEAVQADRDAHKGAHEAAQKVIDSLETQVKTLQASLSSGPVTKADLAEAFSCVWNAALGVSIEQQEGHATASMLAESFHAMAQSLKTTIK